MACTTKSAVIIIIVILSIALYLSSCTKKPPIITNINPESGPSGGGTRVTIIGKNFNQNTTVTIGGAAIKDIKINPKKASIEGITQGGLPGECEVILENPNTGHSPAIGKFLYEELEVIDTDPPDNSEVFPINQVSVDFNQEIKSDSVAITINGIKGEISCDTQKATLTIKTLKPGKDYAIKVSGAKDMANNVMPDYEFKFKVIKEPEEPKQPEQQAPQILEDKNQNISPNLAYKISAAMGSFRSGMYEKSIEQLDIVIPELKKLVETNPVIVIAHLELAEAYYTKLMAALKLPVCPLRSRKIKEAILDNYPNNIRTEINKYMNLTTPGDPKLRRAHEIQKQLDILKLQED